MTRITINIRAMSERSVTGAMGFTIEIPKKHYGYLKPMLVAERLMEYANQLAQEEEPIPLEELKPEPVQREEINVPDIPTHKYWENDRFPYLIDSN